MPGPSAAQVARARAAFASIIASSGTNGDLWRGDPLAQVAVNVRGRIRQFKRISHKEPGGPESYSPASYTSIEWKDARLVDFGFTGGGTVAPDVRVGDQWRVGSAHYNVIDVVGDGTFQPGLEAVVNKSA